MKRHKNVQVTQRIATSISKCKAKVSVLIGDNLSSQIQQEVIIECEKSQISFVCLPKNSTHLTQLLDVGFFRPLKQAWRRTLDKWKSQNTRIKASLAI